MGLVGRVGQMGRIGRGENCELGTSCRLAPAGGELFSHLTPKEALEKLKELYENNQIPCKKK